VIGEEVQVAEGARVKDSVLLPQATVPGGASVVGEVLIS
jgi:ADP-glucose pyrophosphorylase